MTALPHLSNAAARRLFLDRHLLSAAPVGAPGRAALRDMIGRLGFVQVDSVNTVERAHHMILFARQQSYRPADLKALLERDRALFEHWTHDAAVIPVEFFPHWRHRFARNAAQLKDRWTKWQGAAFHDRFAPVLAHIRENGAALSRDLCGDTPRKSGGWWDWHPSKAALEYLWRTGELSVCHRDGFQKAYDLTERVIPAEHRAPMPPEREFVDWACAGALDRLGFATHGEIAAFWAGIAPEEAKAWCAAHAGRDLIEIAVEGAAGQPTRRAWARPDVLEAAKAAPEPTGRLRILSPFDPALRDRNRAERLFGFSYRIEIFVPEAQRRYGYYVFPILEGDRLVGRIDMKCDRDRGALAVRALWPERGVAFGAGRKQRLEAELQRMARFTGMERVDFADGWLRAEG